MINELNRLGRSIVEMLVQVNAFIERGVAIKTLDEHLENKTLEQLCQQRTERTNLHVKMQKSGDRRNKINMML